jgi:hydrogenase maturation protease
VRETRDIVGEAIRPVAVVGIGNVLLGDDAFGPTVLAVLAARWDIPDSVELIDAGTPGLDLASLLCGREAVVLIDAVAASGNPGELFVWLDEELAKALTVQVRVSPHDPAVADALAVARLVGEGPLRTALVGVVPESVDVALGLSEKVAAAAPRAATMVAGLLEEFGVEVTPRPGGAVAQPWWQPGGVHSLGAQGGNR